MNDLESSTGISGVVGIFNGKVVLVRVRCEILSNEVLSGRPGPGSGQDSLCCPTRSTNETNPYDRIIALLH